MCASPPSPSSVPLPVAEAEALAALRIIAGALAKAVGLRRLDLSDNALGEKGIRAAAAAFSQQVRRGGGWLLAAGLLVHRVRCLLPAACLRCFPAGSCGPLGVPYLPQSLHPPPTTHPKSRQAGLESIAFQNVGCSVHGCAALEELLALRCAATLRRLHLYNNMSGDEGAASIAR